MTRNRFWRAFALSLTSSVLCAGAAQAQETFKLGVVTFLSGPAAESYLSQERVLAATERAGAEAANRLLMDALDEGSVAGRPRPDDEADVGAREESPKTEQHDDGNGDDEEAIGGEGHEPQVDGAAQLTGRIEGEPDLAIRPIFVLERRDEQRDFGGH